MRFSPLLLFALSIWTVCEGRQPEPYTRYSQRSIAESSQDRDVPTAPQCCKVGERLGNRLLACPNTYSNTLTSRTLLKPLATNTPEVALRRSGFKLEAEVSRCLQRHRKVTGKCCYYATAITRAKTT